MCKTTGSKTVSMHVSMHTLPPKSNPQKRQLLFSALNLRDEDVLEHHRVCSHFPNGGTSQFPSFKLCKQFASPKNILAPRSVRANARVTKRNSLEFLHQPLNKDSCHCLQVPVPHDLLHLVIHAQQMRAPVNYCPFHDTTLPGEMCFSD